MHRAPRLFFVAALRLDRRSWRSGRRLPTSKRSSGLWLLDERQSGVALSEDSSAHRLAASAAPHTGHWVVAPELARRRRPRRPGRKSRTNISAAPIWFPISSPPLKATPSRKRTCGPRSRKARDRRVAEGGVGA